MTANPSSASFFERMYREQADPWEFASSQYEQGRYQAICIALEHRRYHRAFEPGCSIGVLTARLAAICDTVEACDLSATAVRQARERCQSMSNVAITCGGVPAAIPNGHFDLIVLSEIGYYFDEMGLLAVMHALLAHLSTGGTLLAAHWLGSSKDHALSGDSVHERIRSIDGLAHEYAERQAGFRLDRWLRA